STTTSPGRLITIRHRSVRPQANWICRCADFRTDGNECAILQRSHRWAPSPDQLLSSKSAGLRNHRRDDTERVSGSAVVLIGFVEGYVLLPFGLRRFLAPSFSRHL